MVQSVAGREACWGGWLCLRAPPPRARPPLSARPGTLSQARDAPRGAGQGVAGMCRSGVRGLSRVRVPRARCSAGALRHLPCLASSSVALQAPRFVSELRRPAYGRECGIAGGPGVCRAAGTPRGVERSASVAVSVRKPSRGHGPGARRRLPLHRDSPDQQGGQARSRAMAELIGALITDRVAVGPQQGRKVFTLQTLPAGEASSPPTAAIGRG